MYINHFSLNLYSFVEKGDIYFYRKVDNHSRIFYINKFQFYLEEDVFLQYSSSSIARSAAVF